MIARSFALVLAWIPAIAFAQACGELTNAYGPFDYRTARQQLKIVEAYHFTPDVETLRSGSTATVGGDLDYTLRASPNHHRALSSMVNLALKTHTNKPRGAHFTIDCYFDRAIRFANNDGVVRIIYGIYLLRTNHARDAVRVFETAKALEPNNPNLYYNLGLAYFDLKDYSDSLENAHRAYRLGAPLPGLRDKLQAVGQWREPTAKEDSPSETGTTSSPAGEQRPQRADR